MPFPAQGCCAHCHRELAASRRGVGVILCQPCEQEWEACFLAFLAGRTGLPGPSGFAPDAQRLLAVAVI